MTIDFGSNCFLLANKNVRMINHGINFECARKSQLHTKKGEAEKEKLKDAK